MARSNGGDMLLMVAVGVACMMVVVQGRLSGFYGDNGYDQTVIHRTLTLSDQLEVEHEILELLGLPDRPMRKHHSPSLRKSAPQFLMDIYRRMLVEEQQGDGGASAGASRSTRSISNTADDDLVAGPMIKQVIDQSDIIMTFLNKHHHIAEVRHERGRRIWFDVSEVSRDLTLIMAELRLYQRGGGGGVASTSAASMVINSTTLEEEQHHPHQQQQQHHHHPQHLTAADGTEFTISVYNIINSGIPAGGGGALKDGHKELQLLASVNTTSEHTGWLEFNVTLALAQWIGNGELTNKGLYIGAHPVARPEHEIKLAEIGVVTKGDEEYQPFMVGFFQGAELVIHPTRKQQQQHHSSGQNRVKRNVSKRKKSEARNPFMDQYRQPDTKSCQIQQLYVSFKDLNWQDWIIAPDGYGAYYCSGECNFPLNSHMNATNHAIVQTLVHLMHPTKVPKPCCAPTKLSPISVLYFLDESNVNLKKYRNMVVKSCGCH